MLSWCAGARCAIDDGAWNARLLEVYRRFGFRWLEEAGCFGGIASLVGRDCYCYCFLTQKDNDKSWHIVD